MTKCRHIDTTGLPEGHNASVLIASGVTPEQFLEWCKERVKDGPPKWSGKTAPPVKKKAPAKKKTTAKKTPGPAVKGGDNVVALRQPKPDENLGVPPAFSEDSLAEKFSEKFEHSLIFVASWAAWLVWEESRWQKDETGYVLDLSRKICKKASSEVLNDPGLGAKKDKISNMISSRKMFSNVAAIARTDRRHAAIPAQFDSDPWILNTPDGVVDLKSGQLRPARREDYASKCTAIGPGPESQTWIEFLKRATDGDDALQEYLARLAGYCLTGSVAEHAFFFFYGSGSNGKGTFSGMLHWILNTYSKVAQMETFTAQRFQKHSAEIADFFGARMLTAHETEEGKRWNESRLKQLTGGDAITAQWMRENPFTFQPTFKLLFTGNHKPALRNIDEAMKRRLHLIPFEVKIPAAERDITLPDKLRAEGGGILQWAIDGCLEWQKRSLDPPGRVLATTKEYFEDEDFIGKFIDDRCEISDLYRVRTTGIYNSYCKWAEEVHEYTLSRKRFLDMMKSRDYYSVKLGGDQVIEGLRLQQTEEQLMRQQNWQDD